MPLPYSTPQQQHQYYQQAFAGLPRPFAFIDADALAANAANIFGRLDGKLLRVATKSIRVPWVLQWLQQHYGGQISGYMTFHALESEWLASQGYTDLLVGYPCYQAQDADALCRTNAAGATVRAMADLPQHLDALNAAAGRAGIVLPVCVDVDMSMKLPGLHFGVQRSSIRRVEDMARLLAHAATLPHIKLDALMGYEAQIAGVQDTVPGQAAMNAVLRLLKRRSIPQVASRRAAMVAEMARQNSAPVVVNGGGSGSIEYTRQEAAVTEITAGSAFFTSALFDHYHNFHTAPAAGYGLEVTRLPEPGIVTCLGGGYPASGAPGWEKVPSPWLPQGLKLLKNEGAGEVQTPLQVPAGVSLAPGDTVYMRHGKAGELFERFTHAYIVQGGRVAEQVPTYRGLGKCFL